MNSSVKPKYTSFFMLGQNEGKVNVVKVFIACFYLFRSVRSLTYWRKVRKMPVSMKGAKLIIASFSILILCSVNYAQARGGSRGGSHSVRAHVTKKGKYVAPHRATNRNSTKMDNWSTRGNVNPYTGKAGTRSSY